MNTRNPRPLMPAWLLALLLLLLIWARPADAQPMLLSQTGFDAQRAIAFTPVHPLWSDGTAKRRWLQLPPGTAIDARDPDAWVFPRGTKLWKEFAYGSKVETRYLERLPDGPWRYATYVWRADGSDAELAPVRGRTLAVADAPGGRYEFPSHNDCRNCHDGAMSPVLGFSALQLQDAVPELVARGLIRHAPAAWRREAPRIAGASEAERAARGYLHGNCGHCHHDRGGVPVPMVLAHSVAGAPPMLEPAQLAKALQRMGSRDPYTQMPPLATRITDARGLALVQGWAELSARITAHLTSNVNPQEH